MQLKAANPAPVPCPICETPAPILGTLDFHKSCIALKGVTFAPAGIDIPYRRCPQCLLVFSNAFDDWSEAEFRQHIYNDDYALVDPDYNSSRSADNAAFIDNVFGEKRSNTFVIDYGGGSGMLAEALRQRGYRAETYDPFSQHSIRPQEKADLVTAFEVMEHSNRPYQQLDDMLSFLKPGGSILCSTMLQAAEFEQQGLNWWYIAPRNAHITIYSAEALRRLFAARGFKIVSILDRIHFAAPLADAAAA